MQLEKDLVFAPCILQKVRNKKTYAKTKPLIKGRLDAWVAGRNLTLVKEVEDAAQEDGWGTPHDRAFELETTGRKYNAMVKGGCISSAVRMVTT